MLSDEWLSRYGLLENFNASVTRTGTGTWTTGVTAIALCTSCGRAKNQRMSGYQFFAVECLDEVVVEINKPFDCNPFRPV